MEAALNKQRLDGFEVKDEDVAMLPRWQPQRLRVPVRRAWPRFFIGLKNVTS